MLLERASNAEQRAVKPSFVLRRPNSKRMSHASILLLLLTIAVCLGILLTIFFSSEQDTHLLTLLTFLMNGLLGLFFLAKAIVDKTFSLCQVHWVFYLSFFVFAPLAQLLNGYSPWGYCLSEEDYQITNILIFLWGALFAAAGNNLNSSGSRPKKTIPFNQKKFFSSMPRIPRSFIFFCLLVEVCVFIALLAVVGLYGVFSSTGFSTGFDQTSNLLFNNFMRRIPLGCVVFSIIYFKQNERTLFNWVLLLVALALLIATNFPINLSRYAVAAIYGCVLVLLWPPLMEKKGLFSILLLIALLLVWPAMNTYRHDDFELFALLGSISDTFSNLPAVFCADDYDAYSILARAMHYISANGATNGVQLLTVVFFFVPRSIWAQKSVGSGAMIALAQGQTFTNISCPLPAEGLVNFGVFGLMAFAVILALVCAAADNKFFLSKNALWCFYPCACFYLFFMMRGDLLSSFAYVIGTFLAFCVVYLALVVWGHVHGGTNEHNGIES